MASASKPKYDPDDFVSTSGKGEIPAELRRRLPEMHHDGALPDLDRQITQMLMLHPEIALEFRGAGELAEMSDEAKRLLLRDIQSVLEIDPSVGNS